MVVMVLALGLGTDCAHGATPIVAPGDSGTFDTDFGDDTDFGEDTDLTPDDTDDTDLVGDTDSETDVPPSTDTDPLDTGQPFCFDCMSASEFAGESGGPPTCEVGFAIGAASQAPVLAGLLAAAIARRRRARLTRRES